MIYSNPTGRARSARRRTATVLVACVAGAWAAGGCSSFSETHYFKSEGQPANYYRLRVYGNTGLGSARYLSGYFDEDAVNEYFNETAQPPNAHFPTSRPSPDVNANGDGTSEGTGDGASDSEATRVRPLGASKDDNRILVMLLSSNSDEIAKQIGAFAENRQIAATLGKLLTRGQTADQRAAARELSAEKTRGATVAALGDVMAQQLADAEAAAAAEGGDPAAAATKVTAASLQFVNRVAAELGHPDAFGNLDEAKTWLKANRGRLLSE